MSNSATPWTVEAQTTLSSIISQSLLKFMFTGLMMLSNHLILCYTLLFLLSIFSSIRVFSKESALCIRWLKYWHFSFNISASNEHPGLISFWIARRSNQSVLKEISPEYLLERLMLKLKLQHFGHLLRRVDSLKKIMMLGKIDGKRRRGQ